MFNQFSEANYGRRDTSCDPEAGTYIMFLKKFARPNKKLDLVTAHDRQRWSLPVCTCQWFYCIKACRHIAGHNSLNAFSLFRLQCELSLWVLLMYSLGLI